MSDVIDDVTIVGGGDAGLLTALALDRLNPQLDVSVVDDFEQAVPRVGKSTYVAVFQLLHESLGIDEQRFVQEVKPVWKATVYFRDWCGYEPFHYPFDVADKFPAPDTPGAVENHALLYEELYDSPDHRTKCEEVVEQGKSPWYFDARAGETRKYNTVAYHLNTRRFNAFLREVCRERGISLVDDEVTAVDVDGDRVQRVRSKRQSYEADLFVDASGFTRALKGELDDEFNDFNLPLDTAFNVRHDRDLADVIPATVVETGDHGWLWTIDTYDDRDRGYVFASDYVDEDDALAEFLDDVEGDVDAGDVAKYEFTSGYYEHPWQGNLVTIGNAVGFVEPLQSTGLTANLQAAVNLSNLLSARGRVASEATRDTYNRWVRREWNSIYDFIAVHYKFSSGETAFWQDMADLDVSPRLEHLIEEFDRAGFDTNLDPTRNRAGMEDLLVFRPRNFFQIMRNMGAESEFYEEHDFAVSDEVREEEDEYYAGVTADVEEFYTTRELYKGVLGL
ncbi:MAG: FAD-dependent oxidoreductase [Haloarculaceae archaeon]